MRHFSLSAAVRALPVRVVQSSLAALLMLGARRAATGSARRLATLKPAIPVAAVAPRAQEKDLGTVAARAYHQPKRFHVPLRETPETGPVGRTCET
jgi:hypothetical protein